MARVPSSWPQYLSSLGDELFVQSRRVRNLIGDRHWLSDGHHKEQLLIGLLSRHLPSGVIASRGFVIHPRSADRVSKEQDILLVDTRYEAPVFCQSGLVIAFPTSVLAAISVKTELGSVEVKDSVSGLNSVRAVARDLTPQSRIWCGAFFFEVGKTVRSDPSKVYEYTQQALRNDPVPPSIVDGQQEERFPNVLSASQGPLFLLNLNPETAGQPNVETLGIRGYSCGKFATAVFLADLIRHLAVVRGGQEPDLASFVDQDFSTALEPATANLEIPEPQ